MAIVLSCQSVTKSYSSRPLFRNITMGIEDTDRLGMIGPNGAGKSTLLKLFAHLEEPDNGSITLRKGLRVAYVPQHEKFPVDASVLSILTSSVEEQTEEHIRKTRASIVAAQLGFEDENQLAGSLSGGWQKRLSLGCQLVKDPELLLLDEPTNHLDLEGVLWLEKLLATSRCAFVLVTHDRAFLEQVSNRVIELNAAYAEGYLSVAGKYSDFLVAREQYMGAQAHLEQAIASRVRREVAWLQRGAQARQKKSQGRIQEAQKLFEMHAEVKFRNAQDTAIDVDFSASGRKTRELLVAKGLRKSMGGGKELFRDLDVVLRPGARLGLLGKNGSGKTTLIRVLTNQLPPDAGTIKRADNLRVVWFDQNREQLDQRKSLKESLCPCGDAVVFRDRSLHVATWARRFLFRSDQLNMPISYLSGGEQARILIANLMLQPADILILDEPTNDLDIPSLEVLEESLLDFPGAIILVTHDRFMLDTVSNTLLTLDGLGSATFFIDYNQWEQNRLESEHQQRSTPAPSSETPPDRIAASSTPERKKRGLSTNEKRELFEMESKIQTAEAHAQEVERRLHSRQVASDHARLQAIMDELAAAKQKVDQLYIRWQDLEQRAADS